MKDEFKDSIKIYAWMKPCEIGRIFLNKYNEGYSLVQVGIMAGFSGWRIQEYILAATDTLAIRACLERDKITMKHLVYINELKIKFPKLDRSKWICLAEKNNWSAIRLKEEVLIHYKQKPKYQTMVNRLKLDHDMLPPNIRKSVVRRENKIIRMTNARR